MKKKRLSVFSLIVTDLFCIILGLNVFALFHHVLPPFREPTPVVLITPSLQEPSDVSVPSPSQEPAPEPTEQPERKFAGKLTDGEIIETDMSYQSGNFAVFTQHVEEDGVIYNVADIYLADISYLKTAFGGGKYCSRTEDASALAESCGAVIAISGDHCGARREGMVVRNGVLYRDTLFEDMCIIDSEGVMTTLEAPFDESIAETVIGLSPWQVWSFGPALLDAEGNAKTEFNSSVKPRNPRTAIGYYEPGHYCFVEVDGRIPGSVGMSMTELSEFFHELGCTAAYNLDGGSTSGFIWNGRRLSYPYGRDVWDIIYIGE